MKNVQINIAAAAHSYEIEFGNLTANSGEWAKKCLAKETRKIAVISNRKVFALYGETVKNEFENAGFEVLVRLIGDGEKYKNFGELERALEFLSEKKITRTDAVAALGGGVVGDLAGFAAAVYLRGIAFLQMPTTIVAMIDSSVGGKTAVNTRFGKNLIGAFYQPRGVFVDVETIKTLACRDITAGFCEAVKQGAIGSRTLFEETADFLKNYSVNSFKKHFSNAKFIENLQHLLAAQVSFKAEIVAQDVREDANRTDERSRKILNFGHTVAHALEKITGYKYFRHGEAVGYGMLVAGEISKIIVGFNQGELKSFSDAVGLTGTLPAADKIEIEEVIKAFAFDKKQMNDSLQWILLEAIGSPKILQSREIPDRVIKKSIEKVFRK